MHNIYTESYLQYMCHGRLSIYVSQPEIAMSCGMGAVVLIGVLHCDVLVGGPVQLTREIRMQYEVEMTCSGVPQ